MAHAAQLQGCAASTREEVLLRTAAFCSRLPGREPLLPADCVCLLSQNIAAAVCSPSCLPDKFGQAAHEQGAEWLHTSRDPSGPPRLRKVSHLRARHGPDRGLRAL